MTLTEEQIARLIAIKSQPRAISRHPLLPQEGPLRWIDTSQRCASRGCNSPTYCKVEGVPYCMIHALHILNELIVDLQKRAFDNLKTRTGESEAA